MSDILKNTAQGMVAGAVLGYQVGSNLRDRLNQQDELRTAREWQLYAQQLTEELRQTKAKLATANDKVVHREEAYEKMTEVAKSYAIQAAEAGHEVEEKDREIHDLMERQERMQLEQDHLKAEQEKLNQLKAAQAKHLKFLEAQVEKLKYSSQHNSAQAAAYDGLFKLLADEIARGSNIDDFSNLDPSVIQKAYQSAYLGFMRTGKVVYEPDQNVAQVAAKISKKAP